MLAKEPALASIKVSISTLCGRLHLAVSIVENYIPIIVNSVSSTWLWISLRDYNKPNT